ncbi:MAG: hypothetical protein EOP49_03675 [Sphingobacteriales bacterium]|nr:MAG: hypothetical protein EOP49_03675 [Sphingobacteriales bacterium]
MQKSASEIYLSFKSISGVIPVLLNAVLESKPNGEQIHCAGLEIANRQKFEKELLEARKTAEAALSENAEIRQARQELERNQQLLESQYQKLESLVNRQQRILKVISHDLQEPLRKSELFADIIISRNPDLEPEVLRKLSRIVSFNSRMRDILMTVQRYEELGKKTLHYTEIDLTEIITRTATALSRDEHPFEITIKLDVPTIYADNDLMEQLFSQLILNSIMNCPDKRKPRLGITGMIVRKNIFSKSRQKYAYRNFVRLIFEDFVLINQPKFTDILASVNYSNPSGTDSLGLGFCSEIIERHGGSIEARTMPHQGVSFHILLPVDPHGESGKPGNQNS